MTAREGGTGSGQLPVSPETETETHNAQDNNPSDNFRQENLALQEALAAVSAAGYPVRVSADACHWEPANQELYDRYAPTLVKYMVTDRQHEMVEAIHAKHNGRQEYKDVLLQYLECGFALVPIPLGKKGPTTEGWNKREQCITKPAELGCLLNRNAGLAHAFSGTCAIDMDDLAAAERWLREQHGINLNGLLDDPDAVQIKSGRKNRAKLIYRLLEPLAQHKEGKFIDFRCAASTGVTVQDVLPPSVHPDTKRPYAWGGDFRRIPPIPEKLLAVWKGLLDAKPKANGAQRPTEIPIEDVMTIRQRLKDIHPQNHEELWRVLAIVERTLGAEEGWELIDGWDAGTHTDGKPFEPEEVYKTWRDCIKNENKYDNVTIATFIWLADRGVGGAEQAEREQCAVSSVKLTLPSATFSITKSAKEIFAAISPKRTMFIRSEHIVECTGGKLRSLLPAAFRSRVEQYGALFKWGVDGNGKPVFRPSICSKDIADALMLTIEAQEILPKVEAVSNAPVCVERDGKAVVLGKGYDEGARLFVLGGEMPPVVTLKVAVRAIHEILAEYDFATPSDKSRGIAAMLTPGMKVGRWFGTAYGPVYIVEADKSQAGKTYLLMMTHAIYNEDPSTIAKQEGGVGSLDEKLASALIGGGVFIFLDNLRDKVNSQFLESVITAPKSATAREPYGRTVPVDVSRTTFQMTSNGAETTKDLANRSCITRILTREGYNFKKYKGVLVLDHIKAHQPFYLGCVYAIYREWLRQGKPTTEEVRHHFRAWVQSLDWIVQNLFECAPLMDGHEQLKARVSNEALSWLRRLCLAMGAETMLAGGLSASAIMDYCSEHVDLELPKRSGGRPSGDAMHIGQLMGQAFRGCVETEIIVNDPLCGDQVVKEAILVLEGWEIIRQTMPEYDPERRDTREAKRYWIYAEGEGAKVGAKARAAARIAAISAKTVF